MSLPLGEKAHAVTHPVWPVSVIKHAECDLGLLRY